MQGSPRGTCEDVGGAIYSRNFSLDEPRFALAEQVYYFVGALAQIRRLRAERLMPKRHPTDKPASSLRCASISSSTIDQI